ncbi:MAG: hypothetical protein HC869_02685, partial [Rhodospirillales bacterium]|nr:hypothetical protein [Rhodospirillales bacterium]
MFTGVLFGASSVRAINAGSVSPSTSRSPHIRDRLPLPGTWESAGVEGGIPRRTTICANVTEAPYNANNTGAVSAVSAIQRAIDSCPSGQVVYVPAGKYKIDNRIEIRKSITLRGAGPSTILQVVTGNPLLIQGEVPWPPPRNNPGYFTSVTGGATRGSRTVTVANAASIAIGTIVMVDEEDDPALVWSRTGELYRSRASMHIV